MIAECRVCKILFPTEYDLKGHTCAEPDAPPPELEIKTEDGYD
ncbi:MAG: hypothetical protein [Mu-like cryoconite phage AB09]|nr:MAG: hypothetical protein [Mu-like cryoconite phage AB09]